MWDDTDDDDNRPAQLRPQPKRQESEATIQARTLLAAGSLPGVRLFRNTVGEGWCGRTISRTDTSVTLAYPRRQAFGLCVGSSDLIGIRSVVITADMVGKTIGQFVAIEEKTRRGVASDEQRAFIAAVRKLGALAEVSRSPEHARMVLTTRFGQAELC